MADRARPDAGRPEREYEKVAAPKRGRSASAQSKPGRSLALILIAIVALTGGMFLSGNTTPRLGIDLAGGTSITLKAKADQGSAINKANMDTAVDIMNRRVNGLGVSEAEVQTQGNDHIIVNIPKGTNSKQAQQQVGTTAKLYFRPVLASEPSGPAAKAPSPSASSGASGSPSPSGSSSATPSSSASSGQKATSPSTASPSASATSQGRAVTDALKADATPSSSASPSGSSSASPSPSGSSSASPSASPSGSADTSKLQAQYAALDCSKPADRAKAGTSAKPGEPTVACGENDKVWYKYLLGPAAVDGTDVKKAQAVFDTQGASGWQVQMNFTSSGSKKFANITGELAKNQSPQNEFAIVLDGNVVSSPFVQGAISGGQAEITGRFTQQEAQSLSNMLSYGALPLSF
jgi:preprotein translocase subunit SecD